MKRLVTLDVLRGACIIVMVGVHVFSSIFDKSWIGTEEMASRTLLDIFFLLGLAYLGGMTGLFLMVSMVAHTISVNGQLEKGRDLKSVMLRQITAGVILIVFAFLVEGTLGQYGFLGRMAYFDPLGDRSFQEMVSHHLPRIFYRGFHFMTLQTIGFCIVINSGIQWLMYRKGGRKKISRNFGIYIGLAAAVILLTPVMWGVADAIIPGYPFAQYPGSDRMVQYPLEGTSTIPEILLLRILAPIAGQTEPLFPFLFISFTGVLIGMYLSLSEVPKKICNKGIKLGLAMTAIGAVGIQIMWILGLDSWSNLENDINSLLNMKVWFPILLVTTGGQLIILFLTLRMVEFRGIQNIFAEKTRWIRRFGAASLTIFTIQWIDAFPRFFLSLLPGVDVFGHSDGMMVSLGVVLIVILMWDLILRLWTRLKLVGSFEWFFSQTLKILGRIIFKVKKTEMKVKNWWYVERLDLFSASNPVEWTDFSRGRSGERGKLKDCRLCYYISISGILFFPLSFMAYLFTRKLERSEIANQYLKRASFLSRLGLILAVVEITVMSITNNYLIK